MPSMLCNFLLQWTLKIVWKFSVMLAAWCSDIQWLNSSRYFIADILCHRCCVFSFTMDLNRRKVRCWIFKKKFFWDTCIAHYPRVSSKRFTFTHHWLCYLGNSRVTATQFWCARSIITSVIQSGFIQCHSVGLHSPVI
jgi:hypothetical protein